MTPDQLTDYLLTHEAAIQTARAYGDQAAWQIVSSYRAWRKDENPLAFKRLQAAALRFRRRQEARP